MFVPLIQNYLSAQKMAVNLDGPLPSSYNLKVSKEVSTAKSPKLGISYKLPTSLFYVVKKMAQELDGEMHEPLQIRVDWILLAIKFEEKV